MNSYNTQSWGNYQQGQQFPQAQLEQEFEFPVYNHLDFNQLSPEVHGLYQPQRLASSSPQTTHGTYPTIHSQSHSRTSSFGQSSSLSNAFGQQPLYAPSTPNQPATALNPTAFVNQPMTITKEQNIRPTAFQFQAPGGLTLNTGNNHQHPPTLSTGSLASQSPGPLHQSFPSQSQPPKPGGFPPSPGGQAANKRARHGEYVDEDDEGGESDVKEEPKTKLSGACARCKNLKVRCEFVNNLEMCKRCAGGNHQCTVPGRKKRRAPPKREHLLNEIRQQADQIKALMSQLEALNTGGRRGPGSEIGTTSSLHSPVLSPSSPTGGSFAGSENGRSSSANPETNQVVADWIAKARESLEEFGGFIAGGGLPGSYLVDQDSEDLSGDDDDISVPEEGVDMDVGELAEGSVGIRVEYADGDCEPQSGSGSRLRHKSSSSSLGSTGTTTTRRKGAEKSAILPNEAAPFGLLGGLALKRNLHRASSAQPGETDDSNTGIAGDEFFSAGPNGISERLAKDHQPPYILSRGLITPTEAENLFNIYFDKINFSVSLLDPVMYTAQRTYYRSPFLFTVVCAVASRFYPERPDLYPQAMHYAQLAAGTALISGKKNVEMCAAYILLSLYPVPAKRWEDQRSWLYLGLAIRCATDLNLHLPNTAKEVNEVHAREMLNRTRIWLNCYNLDRSTGSQYGKPPTIPNTDYVASHCEDWWKSSTYNLKHFDIHLCAYNAELRVMANFMAKIYNKPENPSGLNKEVDLETIAVQTDDELQALGEKWFGLLEKTDMTDPQNSFRTGLLRLAYSYARLGCLSYGFQQAFAKNQRQENPFLIRCLNAATDVVNAVIYDICKPNQVTYIKHGPEAQSVFVTFASAFLIKLLQPKFASFLVQEKRVEVQNLVQQVIDLLGSEKIAIDDRHGPKLYSRFLKGLLSMVKVNTVATSSSRRQRRTKSSSESRQTPERATPPPAGSSPVSNTTSPPRSSLSPAPAPASLSLDSFAPIGHGAIDPFVAIYSGSLSNTFDPSFANGLDVFYNGSDADTIMGQPVDNYIPGFDWMTTLQDNLGINVRNASVQLYNNGLFTADSAY